MIYYIHGFRSCALANEPKVLELKKMFPSETVIGLDYDSFTSFDNIFNTLMGSIDPEADNFFIGTSLGAYYARILAEETGSNCVLFNPLIDPVDSLKPGMHINYCTGLRDFMNRATIESYYGVNFDLSISIPTTVFLSKNDEVLDNEKARNLFKKFANIIDIDEGHRINTFNPYAKEIISTRNSIIL